MTSSDVPIGGGRALDFESPVPLYFQLAVALSEKLETGSRSPGARFATEREIEDEFDVSRSVVRRALELLVGDGTIVRVRGAGTFVNAARHSITVAGVLKTLLEPGKVTLEVVTVREEVPDSTLVELLEVDRKTTVAHVTGVLRVERESVGLVDSYLAAGLLPGLMPALAEAQAGTSPSRFGKAVELTRASVPIELTHFGEWGGAQVGVTAGDPALRGTLLQFGRPAGRKRERPIELAHLVYRADNVQLAVELD
jgi:GntR family transcriptional regulator